MDDRPGLEQEAALAKVLDDRLGDLVGGEPVEPEARKHAPGLVERREHGEVVDPRELEVLGARARSDVDDARSLVQSDVVPGDDPVDDALLRGEMVERPFVLEADELAAEGAADERLVGVESGRDPVAVLPQAVVRGRVDGGGDVRRKRPRCRRPDGERLAVAPLERKADVERRMLELPVLAGEDLVLGDRGPAARAPHGRAVALVEPLPFVDGLQEAPDVLDVRVGEGVVVRVPVHPHAEAPWTAP